MNALDEAASLKLDTVQIFTKNQRQWRVKPLDPVAAEDWRARMKGLGWEGRCVAHDSYLINLASPNDELWEKSVRLMREEIERCETLGIPLLVSHPGAHTGAGLETGIRRIARAYARLFRETAGCRTTVCLENTAGGGSTIGRTFEELAACRRLILEETNGEAERRVGFCLDTCHLLAGGYDIGTEGKMRRTLREFDDLCGLERLRALHLNDSKGALGSRIDRHEHIGKGRVGLAAFAALVKDRRLRRVPKILETPKGKTPKGTPLDTLNLRRLRKLARDGTKPGRIGGRRKAAARA